MTSNLAHIPSDWSTTEPDLEEILSASPVVLYTLELEAGRARATWISNNLPRLVGESVADALVKPNWWATRIHPEDRPTALARQIELIERGKLVHQYRFRHRDGHYIWIRDELKLVVSRKWWKLVLAPLRAG